MDAAEGSSVPELRNLAPSDRFRYVDRVRYVEVDQQGVVFNAHYLTYADNAFAAFLDAAGITYEVRVEQHGLDWHVKHAEITWNGAAAQGDLLVFDIYGLEMGRTSITYRIQVSKAASGEELATARIVNVMVEANTSSPTAVPDDVRDRLVPGPTGVLYGPLGPL